MALGKAPRQNHFGIQMPNSDARRPSDVPQTALELNICCQTTARVHCGMMYGKMKIELKYFLKRMLVLVTRKAKKPPYRMEITQVMTERITVFRSGFQRLVFARRLVKRST